jgi:site-specific recombinase XerC
LAKRRGRARPNLGPASDQAAAPFAARGGLVNGTILRVVDELRRHGALSDQSMRRLVEVMARFLAFLERGYGRVALSEVSHKHVKAFVLAPVSTKAGFREPSVATAHLRRSGVRLLFRVLRTVGVVEGDPTLDLVLPPRSSLVARPLTDDEIVVCRSFALRTLTETRQPAAWALAEATARTSEIPCIRVRDLDLAARRVWIHGGAKSEPRFGCLSPWGVQQLDRRVKDLDEIGAEPDGPLVYRAAGSAASAQASAARAIRETLTRAGLGREPDVRPVSVAAWIGRRLLQDTGRIEAVACGLGVRSLDGAARIIGWDWADPGSSPER